MDVKYINPFLNATVEVLKTMAFMEARAGKPYLKTNHSAPGDVSAIIGITGHINGSLSLTFSSSCIIKIVDNMLGENFQEINDDIKDAVGELTNMISGVARRRLSEIGFCFKIAIPTVVSGPGHQIKHMSKGPTIAIPFDTTAGSFTVEINFSR
ncbi:MAG: chemotaxis protein CheX [Desulfobacca sp. 4484_104]|nr:MAG: chemotaxis protein CheX [Desulfobacca sp. 4484_104]RLA89972.1 MAG: chemotaxis protein CheX [Deltaproteobacteria bacterium]